MSIVGSIGQKIILIEAVGDLRKNLKKKRERIEFSSNKKQAALYTAYYKDLSSFNNISWCSTGRGVGVWLGVQRTD